MNRLRKFLEPYRIGILWVLILASGITLAWFITGPFLVTGLVGLIVMLSILLGINIGEKLK